MNYLNYIKSKLNVTESSDLIEKAIEYIGIRYPDNNENQKGFEVVDIWYEQIKSIWNVEIRILNLSKPNFSGKLISKKGGFILNLNKNLFTTQRRFTIAHEIAHILSYDTSSKWPVYKVYHSRIEEYYCNRIARAMLLPKSLVDFKKIDLTDFKIEQVEQIREIWPEFRVSPWQIILKLYDELDNKSVVCVLWQYFQNESVLRIIDYCKPKGIFIPKKDRIHLTNLLSKNKTNQSPEIAFNSNKLYKGSDLVEIGSIYKKELFCTAFPIKTKAATYVMQIIKI